MSTLNITIIQSNLHWHSPEKNIAMFEQEIQNLSKKTDLIVLPEMFTTGFSMSAQEMAETSNGPSITWMKKIAVSHKTAICGSLIIEEEKKSYNRFLCAMPNGKCITYDKRHLFRLANEQNYYSAGDSQITFKIKKFRIAPMICYDLRFPVWSRNQGHYDLLIYVANWPSKRHYAWETLLRARAIENLSYVAGVNRVGKDNNGINYSGGSTIIDYQGKEIINLSKKTTSHSVELEMKALQEYRNQFAFHKDADRFTLEKNVR